MRLTSGNRRAWNERIERWTVSDEPKTNADRADRIGELIAEIQIDAVEAERERVRLLCMEVATKHRANDGSFPHTAMMIGRKLRDLDLSATSKPSPADEPMTVEKAIEELAGIAHDTPEDRADRRTILTALVWEQVRRDAEWLCNYEDGYDYLGRKLLKSAGLK